MTFCIVDARISTSQADMVFNNAYPGKTVVEHVRELVQGLCPARLLVLTNGNEAWRETLRASFPAGTELYILPGAQRVHGMVGLGELFEALRGSGLLAGSEEELVVLRPGVGVVGEVILQRVLAARKAKPGCIAVNCEVLDGGEHPSWLYLANNLADKQVYRVGPTPLFNLVNPALIFEGDVASRFPLIHEIAGSQFLPALSRVTGSVIACGVASVLAGSAPEELELAFCPADKEEASPVFVYNLPIFVAPA